MTETDVFPLEVKLGDLKSLIGILKENDGSASLSKIAEESEEEFEVLFPLLEAGKLLGLMTIMDGIVTLTEMGNSISNKEFRKKVGKVLSSIQPFKSLLEHMRRKRSLSTEELFDFMLEHGYTMQINREDDIHRFRKEMADLLIRTYLCDYDSDEDSWKALKEETGATS